MSERAKYVNGQRVFEAPAIPPSKANVDYWRNNPLGQDIAAALQDIFKDCKGKWADCLKFKIGQYREGQLVPKGHYFFEAAVSTALDMIGEDDVWTSKPDEVMGLLRPSYDSARTPQISKNTWNDFGVLIREVADRDPPFIREMLAQAEIKPDMLPVVLFHLRARPDNSSIYGVKLEYTEKSGLIYSPALAASSLNFHTADFQRIEDLLSSGREREGKLEVRVSNARICVLLRRDDFQLNAAYELFRHFNLEPSAPEARRSETRGGSQENTNGVVLLSRNP
ncbi:hypothetical protein HYY70_02490 [Candidatus Woesearchaeota archaeon]|nr:hypothetical protein [Candidatus Woesearchaeota archaeon]